MEMTAVDGDQCAVCLKFQIDKICTQLTLTQAIT